jgi:hypothetical protein
MVRFQQESRSELYIFDQEHILISRRYQLHSAFATTHCPSGIIDAHNPKKRRITIKEKSRYSDLFLLAVVLTPPRKHQKSSFSKSDDSKKKTMHTHRPHPII